MRPEVGQAKASKDLKAAEDDGRNSQSFAPSLIFMELSPFREAKRRGG